MQKNISDCLRLTCFVILPVLLNACRQDPDIVTTSSMLEEMSDLSRLAEWPDQAYKTVQYSSYDRRSTHPDAPFWFANEDGFGNEPLPGFEEILKEPDEEGIGEYLICDIKGPGSIVRLWTAGISGNIRFYLDDIEEPVYEGNAEDFFWLTLDVLSGQPGIMENLSSFRQFDAVYFPIPFADRCRIEWIGDIRKIHFYHVGVRFFDAGIKVETFRRENIATCLPLLKDINQKLQESKPDENLKNHQKHLLELKIPASNTVELLSMEGPSAIQGISLKVHTELSESTLRKTVLRIYFDGASRPQVESPLGDFFGAAPGIYAFHSLPVSTFPDSTFVCRFIMPFQTSVRMEIENTSEEEIGVSGSVISTPYAWKEASSMHFHARWKIDYDLTAQPMGNQVSPIEDILYAAVEGKGRIVGAAAFIYNPSNVPTSWGNWWGEGDEKITIDRDTFPSFFGTGSEDYYNYSWSSARLFSFPYCGQPRNDGPGNRGYASNFRWHILDDILFSETFDFYMELGHHGRVPGFSYGRMVYYYAFPGCLENSPELTADDLRDIRYQSWEPEAVAGSAGYDFIQAEDLLAPGLNLELERGGIYAGKGAMIWKPESPGEKISFEIPSEKEVPGRIGLTCSHSPEGGKVSFYFNGSRIKFSGKDVIDLYASHQTLDNHLSDKLLLQSGKNTVELVSMEEVPSRQVGIDFIWVPLNDK